MAEIAAGAYVASEVIEHGAQAGYAAYLVSKPTLPLKATFTRIATAKDDHTKCVRIWAQESILTTQALAGTVAPHFDNHRKQSLHLRWHKFRQSSRQQ